MRKIIFILSAAILALSGCAVGTSAQTAYTLRQMAEAAAATQTELPAMRYLPSSDEYFKDYVTDFYRLDITKVNEGVIFYAGGMLAAEIAVLKMSDGAAASEAYDLLTDYRERRAGAFAGYAPVESAMLADSIINIQGEYVALLFCVKPDEAETAFINCFKSNPPSPPVEGSVIKLAEEEQPTEQPAEIPAEQPTEQPAEIPAEQPTDTPTEQIMGTPNGQPTDTPTEQHNEAPTEQFTETPTEQLTENPTEQPTEIPTEQPTQIPTDTPTDVPTEQPTQTPAELPTQPPYEQPTPTPSVTPDNNQQLIGTSTVQPSESPAAAPTPAPDVPGVYDHEAILLAASTGDTEGLSAKNLDIYNFCTAVIADVVTGDMDELEKERAIHDYLVGWIKYDSAVHDQGPDSHPDPDNNNPYGALINQKAICTGYAYSFELLMDMLGYECITIEGRSGSEPHGWNMIVIGGEWYCVDVTWDDSGRTLKHFNKSSEDFRRSGHQWDETAGYPVAPKSMD